MITVTRIKDQDEYMARHLCPKCSQMQAWYETEDGIELIQRCICGYHKVVYSELAGGGTYTQVLPRKKVNMPRVGSKLSKCLGALFALPDRRGSTREVASKLSWKSPEVASQLMVLQHKGLVLKEEDNRGKAGGSFWAVTELAVDYLNVGDK